MGNSLHIGDSPLSTLVDDGGSIEINVFGQKNGWNFSIKFTGIDKIYKDTGDDWTGYFNFSNGVFSVSEGNKGHLTGNVTDEISGKVFNITIEVIG